MKKIYAYLHTHWDREWYRDGQDFNLRLLDILDVVIDELEKQNAPFFYLDGQTGALIDYLKYRKDKKEEIIKYILQGKLAIGPYFLSIDSYIPSFYSMLKNLDLGLKISKEFKQKEFIGYMADIFGISKNAFLALEFKNIDKAIIWRGVNPALINNNCNFLYDNIKATWLAQGYFNDFFHMEINENTIKNIENYISKIEKYSKNPLLLPIGGDHLGILKDANNKIKKINSYLDDYEIILTSPFEYFKNSEFKNKTKEKEFLNNALTYTLKGTYSARINQKVLNFEVQNKLAKIVEPLNFYLKDKYEENIEEIYQRLVKNHAHDSICSTSIDSVHKMVEKRFEKNNLALNAILKRIKGNFKNGNNTIIKDEFGLFNLTGFDNIEVVKLNLPYKLKNAQILGYKRAFEDDLLYDIYKIPITQDIKKIYTQLVEISKNKRFSYNNVSIEKPIKKTKVTLNSIENENIALFVKDKKISILNKKDKKRYNFYLTDIKDVGDSYNIAPVGNYTKIELKKTKVNYDGMIESSLLLDFGNIKLNCILNNKSKFIHFICTINNKKKNHKIQAVVELKENIQEIISEDSAGIIKRKVDYNYDIRKYMPAKKPVELKTNTFPAQNFAVANDVIIMSKGLNEFEIFKKEFKVTLLRSFEAISNDKNLTRYVPAGPNLKTPDAQLIGKNRVEFALLFGNYQAGFENLDLFLQNYVTIDTNKIKDFELDKIPDNSYIYGMNKGKKIVYNIKEDKILLI